MIVAKTSTLVRPNTDVPWYEFSKSWLDLLKSHKVAIQAVLVDPLTKRTTLTFIDEASYEAWKADPAVVSVLNEHNTYNNFAKIVKTSNFD